MNRGTKRILIGGAILGTIYGLTAIARNAARSIDHLRIGIGTPTFKKVSANGLPVQIPVTVDNKSAVSFTIRNLYVTMVGVDEDGNQSEIAISNQIPSVVSRAYGSTVFNLVIQLTWTGALSFIMNRGFSKIRMVANYNYLGQPMQDVEEYDARAILSQISKIIQPVVGIFQRKTVKGFLGLY